MLLTLVLCVRLCALFVMTLPAFIQDPAFIRIWASVPPRAFRGQRLINTRRLLEVLRYLKNKKDDVFCGSQ